MSTDHQELRKHLSALQNWGQEHQQKFYLAFDQFMSSPKEEKNTQKTVKTKDLPTEKGGNSPN